MLPRLTEGAGSMLMKLFSMPDFAVSIADESAAERLTKAVAADRIRHRERVHWGLRHRWLRRTRSAVG